MTDDETFAPDEWATLCLAPFWVLAALAGCYRGFDPLEFEAFSRAVEEASDRARGRLGGEVLRRRGDGRREAAHGEPDVDTDRHPGQPHPGGEHLPVDAGHTLLAAL